jgi:hypothetical protein
MPWKESSVMDQRLRFVARLIEGEEMTVLCREFGISRKTGYKIYGRYKEHGLEALTDRRVISGIIACEGCRWRALLDEYGPTVFNRTIAGANASCGRRFSPLLSKSASLVRS